MLGVLHETIVWKVVVNICYHCRGCVYIFCMLGSISSVPVVVVVAGICAWGCACCVGVCLLLFSGEHSSSLEVGLL